MKPEIEYTKVELPKAEFEDFLCVMNEVMPSPYTWAPIPALQFAMNVAKDVAYKKANPKDSVALKAQLAATILAGRLTRCENPTVGVVRDCMVSVAVEFAQLILDACERES